MRQTGLARKSLAIGTRDAILLASNLATGIVVARVLGPTGFGVWVIYQLILSYAEGFGRPKFDQAAVYYLGRGTYDLGRMTFILHVMGLGSAAVTVMLIAAAIGPLSVLLLDDAPEARSLLPILFVQIPAQFLYLNYAYLHIAREDVGSYNRMTLLRSMLNSIVIVISLLILGAGLAGVLAATVLSTLAGLTWGAIRLHRQVPLRPGWDAGMIAALTAYGGKLYIGGAVAQLNSQVTNALCAVYLMPAQVAFFSLASARRDLIGLLPNAVNTVLFPRIAATPGAEDAARLAATTARVMFVVLVVVAIAAFILVGPAVLFLYGADFVPVIDVFRMLLPGFVVSGCASAFLQYLLGRGRPGLTVLVAVPTLIVQVLLAAWLIPVIGLHGAALALLVPLLLGSALVLAAFLSVSHLSLPEAVLVRRADLALLHDIARREIPWPSRAHLRR